MRLPRLFAGFGMAFWVTVAGCARYDLIIERQAEMDLRLEQLAKGNQTLNSRLSELEAQSRSAEVKLKEIDVALNEIRDAQVAKVAPPVIESQKIGGENNPAEPPAKIEVVNVDAESKGDSKEKGASDAYLQAFGIYSKSNYNGAIDAFNEFIRSYPDSEYAANAQYWIGECLYTQKEYARALEAFRKVVDSYPRSAKVPDAMLKVGFSHISMKEHDKAKTTMDELVQKFPKSQAADKARERLRDPKFNHLQRGGI
ncbi:MAG: tol-pal system protein YbgF [Geobacter sp.]|nr:tol-pal system protein YbgF [Geobacter sp.]